MKILKALHMYTNSNIYIYIYTSTQWYLSKTNVYIENSYFLQVL